MRGCAFSLSSHYFSLFPLSRPPKPSEESGRVPKAWAARSSLSPTTRARFTGIPRGSRQVPPSISSCPGVRLPYWHRGQTPMARISLSARPCLFSVSVFTALIQSRALLTDKTGDREGCRSVFSPHQMLAFLSCKLLYQMWLSEQLHAWSVAGSRASRAGRPADFDAGAMVSAGNVRLGLHRRNLREPEFEGPEGRLSTPMQVRAGAAFAPRSLPSGVHGPFSLASIST